MQKRSEFIETALEYLGTPYAAGGTSRRGMDCSGLVFRTGVETLEVNLPRSSSALARYAKKISKAELEAGDLVFFDTSGGISHAGIYIGEGDFVHSASRGPKTGVIVSNLSESYWRRTYHSSGRIFPSAEAKSESQEPELQPSESDKGISQERLDEEFGQEPELQPSESDASASIVELSQSYAESLSDAGQQEEKTGLRLELRGTALWDFDYEEWLIRGTTISATAQWRGRSKFYPGLTAGFSWDTRHDTMAVPLYLSVTMQNGLGVFAGTQFIFYSGGEASTDIQDTVFPGIVGVSWTSPSKDFGPIKLSFYQSIECVFVRRKGVAGKWLSDEFRLSTGVSFAIGN